MIPPSWPTGEVKGNHIQDIVSKGVHIMADKYTSVTP